MGKNSKIEWTDHTWNPWYGCRKVSQGCANCYMYREQKIYGRDPATVKRSKTTFRDPLGWAKRARRKGERYRVFTCSWSDFFIEDADPWWRVEAWDIIRQTPELIYLILTKRPELIEDRLPQDWGLGWKHVWLGVSTENQAMADLRIPQLLKIPAQHRFVSCEPLLGPIDLKNVNFGDTENKNVLNNIWYLREYAGTFEVHGSRIDWVIAGGESGVEARPSHPDWIRQLRNQCGDDLKTPFFFKQWGDLLPIEPAPEMRSMLEVEYLKVGRQQAGATLDGMEWRQLPSFDTW